MIHEYRLQNIDIAVEKLGDRILLGQVRADQQEREMARIKSTVPSKEDCQDMLDSRLRVQTGIIQKTVQENFAVEVHERDARHQAAMESLHSQMKGLRLRQMRFEKNAVKQVSGHENGTSAEQSFDERIRALEKQVQEVLIHAGLAFLSKPATTPTTALIIASGCGDLRMLTSVKLAGRSRERKGPRPERKDHGMQQPAS